MADPAFVFALILAFALGGGLLAVAHLASRQRRKRKPATVVGSGSEEEPEPPFEVRTPSKLSPEERLLRVIFGEEPPVSTGPPLSRSAEENGRIKVTRRRAKQPANSQALSKRAPFSATSARSLSVTFLCE